MDLSTPDTGLQTIDVRAIPPRERHPLIFSTFDRLPVGAAMQLVNDHDPKPLYYQLAAEHDGEFGWEYLERGPDTWRVAISRVKAGGAPKSSCCGSCGG